MINDPWTFRQPSEVMGDGCPLKLDHIDTKSLVITDTPWLLDYQHDSALLPTTMVISVIMKWKRLALVYFGTRDDVFVVVALLLTNLGASHTARALTYHVICMQVCPLILDS